MNYKIRINVAVERAMDGIDLAGFRIWLSASGSFVIVRSIFNDFRESSLFIAPCG